MYYMYPIMESTFDNDFTDDNELPSLGIDEESMIPAEMTDSAMDDNAGQQETFNDYGEYIYITSSIFTSDHPFRVRHTFIISSCS